MTGASREPNVLGCTHGVTDEIGDARCDDRIVHQKRCFSLSLSIDTSLPGS